MVNKNRKRKKGRLHTGWRIGIQRFFLQ